MNRPRVVEALARAENEMKVAEIACGAGCELWQELVAIEDEISELLDCVNGAVKDAQVGEDGNFKPLAA